MPEVTGFWIRPVTSPPEAVPRRRRLVRAEDDKENFPAVGPAMGAGKRSVRKRLSNDWRYPRIPLRDLTNIVNALERRRLIVLAARNAQLIREAESSLLVSPAPREPSVTDATPKQISTTCITSFSPVEHPLQTPSGSSSISNTDTETEEKLRQSIDQIEKIVKKNLKKPTNEPFTKRAMQKKTLMSMR